MRGAQNYPNWTLMSVTAPVASTRPPTMYDNSPQLPKTSTLFKMTLSSIYSYSTASAAEDANAENNTQPQAKRLPALVKLCSLKSRMIVAVQDTLKLIMLTSNLALTLRDYTSNAYSSMVPSKSWHSISSANCSNFEGSTLPSCVIVSSSAISCFIFTLPKLTYSIKASISRLRT